MDWYTQKTIKYFTTLPKQLQSNRASTLQVKALRQEVGLITLVEIFTEII